MYFGGKNGSGTYQAIINKIPPHKRYIELCLGSGAILNNKKPALENFGIEINSETIAKFTYSPFAFIVCADIFTWTKENWKLFDKDTFVYVDPPYPLNSRKNSVEVYKHEFTDQQHADIIKLIKTMPAMVAISTYKNHLYGTELKDWNLFNFQSQTRKGPATEYLYMNYPSPIELHDYSFLGKNFTDRQRIKRKIEREITKLKNLPALERQAIISQIKSHIV